MSLSHTITMLEINLLDPKLNDYVDTTELSIQVGTVGFSLCIHSGDDKQIRAFRHYKYANSNREDDLLRDTAEILHKDELLRLPQKKVKVIFTGRKSTLVPAEFIQDDKLKKILEFNQPLDDLDEIHHNLISGCNSHLVFALPTYFAGMISEKFREAVFFNQAIPLLNFALSNLDHQDGDMVYIQLNNDFFDIAIIRNGKLSLYNSFLYVNSVDLLYFILYACKQLKVDSSDATFILFGENSTNFGITRELNEFIPKLLPVEDYSTGNLAGRMKTADRQRFFGLIQLHRCE
jgi:hypothetical protein